MAFLDTFKKKYGEYEKWREGVSGVKSQKLSDYTTPQRNWELLKGGVEGLKEGLLGVPERLKGEGLREGLLGVPEKIREGLGGLKTGIQEMKVGLPGKEVPAADLMKSIKEKIPTPTFVSEEELAKRMESHKMPGVGSAFMGALESLSKPPEPKVEPTPTPSGVEGFGKVTPSDATFGEGTPIERVSEALKSSAPSAPSAEVDLGKNLIGVSDPQKQLSIKKQMGVIQDKLDTLRWQLDLIPGLNSSDKQAYEKLAKDWAEAGASAEDIAKIVDTLTRADKDKLSSKIMPTYQKYLESPEMKKAKTTLDDLYTKYSERESALNTKTAEAEQAMNAIKQSPYLTQSMIVGRTDRMRDEYNMEIKAIQNELNTLGNDIDRGRDALKTMTSQGFKMAEAEIGSLKLGIEEDILGQMPFSWESVARYLRTKPGEMPKTIGAGQFGYDKKTKGWEQVTPFAPQKVSTKQDKEAVTEEHRHYLPGLAGTDGHISLEDFMAAMADWMQRTGDYNPQHYVSMFGYEFLSPENRQNLPMQLLGMEGGLNI